MKNPEYIRDLVQYIESIPYGTVSIPEVQRVNRKVTKVVTVGEETLRYVDNDEAIDDIKSFIKRLIDNEHSGEVTFRLQMKDGDINLIGLFDKKEHTY